MAAKLTAITARWTLSKGKFLSEFLYKLSFNHLLIKLLEKTQFTEFNATDNRVLELYSYACSSGEQNAAISYIIVTRQYHVI